MSSKLVIAERSLATFVLFMGLDWIFGYWISGKPQQVVTPQ